MEDRSEYFEDLKVIKRVMEESSRFLSLSGLSGVFAGIFALLGVIVALFFFLGGNGIISVGYFDSYSAAELMSLKIKLGADAFIVLVLAVSVSLFLSFRKSKRKGYKFWTPVSKRLLVNLMVPLVTGGILILILGFQNKWSLILPVTLIFYGIALVNAGKYTYSEVFYLGLLQILTGLISVVFPAQSLFLWAFGFGILHITYGLIMYRKYEA